MTQMPPAARQAVMRATATPNSRRGWALALVPLVLLAAVLFAFIATDGAGLSVAPAAPVENLHFERVTLVPGGIRLAVRNSSPEPLHVATVFVNDAVVEAYAEPQAEIPRLGRATITIPQYGWVKGEPLHMAVLSANGVKFEHEVAAAAETPQPGWGTALSFFLVGLYVGVLPVGLGMLWFPALKRMGQPGIRFILALTVGLLAFLAIDTLDEAFAFAAQIPGAFQGKVLVLGFAALSLLALIAAGQRKALDAAPGSAATRRMRLAFAIALGIGLHNLGEGLAIGAAYAAGEAALGTFLVVGFTLHNVTEGIGIVSPLTAVSPSTRQFLGLAALAGLPTVAGAWIGGLVASPVLSTIFFAVGAGAILQVIYEVARFLRDQGAADGQPAMSWPNVGGLSAGLALMWLTALLVK